MHGSIRVQVRKSTVARPTKARPKVKPNSFSVGLRPAAFFFPPYLSLSLLYLLFSFQLLHLLFSLFQVEVVPVFTIFSFSIGKSEERGQSKNESRVELIDNSVVNIRWMDERDEWVTLLRDSYATER